MSPLLVVGLVLAGYLCGTLPTGVLVAKARGVDIRTAGSGNIGATNVARILGKPLGALVLLVDALKGFGPVFLVDHLVRAAPAVVAGVGLAAMLGHVFPVWLNFRGGKAVATGLGVFLALMPVEAGIAVVLFIAVYAVWRIASVGSLVAASALLATTLVRRPPLPYVFLAGAAWLIVVVRHRTNIVRLLQHREEKL